MQKIEIETLVGKIIEIDLGTDPFFFLKTTVNQLKEKLINYSEINKVMDDLRFKYEDKILEDDKWLFCYGITNGSKITCEKWYNSKTVLNNHIQYGVKFIRTVDAITNDDNGELKAVLSCGHAVDPNSLTAWCKSLIDDGKVEFFCPAIVDHTSNEKCSKKWSFEEVKRIGLLNEIETEYFEKSLSENSLKAHVDFKQCPRCRSFIERLNSSNLRVKCTICSKILSRNYEFCWQCEREWDCTILNGGLMCNEKTTCGKSDCHSEKDIEILSKCNSINLTSCTNLKDIPSLRACPTCGKLIEHNGVACKNIVCPRCSVEFCFACLETTEYCQKTSPRSWYGSCSKPVAPVQTEIPKWNPFSVASSVAE
jgi:hypothetical protein